MSHIYQRLYLAYKKRYNSELTKKNIQLKCNEYWAQLKTDFPAVRERDNIAEEKIKELNDQGTRKSAGLFSYFTQVGTKRKADNDLKKNEQVHIPSVNKTPTDDLPSDKNNKKDKQYLGSASVESSTSHPTINTPCSYPKPRQEALQKKIISAETELNYLVTKRDSGLSEHGAEKLIKKIRKDLKKSKKLLSDKKNRASWQKNYREKQREELENLKKGNSEAVVNLKVRNKVGRPRVETDQTALLKTISDIAIYSGSADIKRRSEAIRACKTLDDIHQELKSAGLNLSRSATYLRFIPRNSNSIEGKRHVVTVPVKLCRAQSDYHKDHIDQYFCRSTINGLEEVASILGPNQVCIISQDDKAKVPLGITAAKSQAPLLMHLEYKVRLPDHDWMVGSRHKLTPSVYAGIVIKKNAMGQKDAVTHSGPTYIAIRSGKHNSSTATSHAIDLQKLVELNDFQPITKGNDGKIKPVLMLSVDGGPDENPRYKKVIFHAIDFFKKNDLDATFIFTNAPGRSAFNRVERRMAPLSRALSGVILPHDHYGVHLNVNGKTTDEELELKNFEYAGQVLAEIWSELKLDNHNVIAEYISNKEINPDFIEWSDHVWYSNHVRESQYLLQILKCDDSSCCSPYRSSLRKILFQRFLPAPFPLTQEPFGIPSPSQHTVEKFGSLLLRQALMLRPECSQSKEIPYDLYCPSQKEEISSRSCSTCGLYFASKASMNSHKKHIHKNSEVGAARAQPLRVLLRRPGEFLCISNEDTPEWVDIESVEEFDFEESSTKHPASSIPLIKSIDSWMEDGITFIDY